MRRQLSIAITAIVGLIVIVWVLQTIINDRLHKSLSDLSCRIRPYELSFGSISTSLITGTVIIEDVSLNHVKAGHALPSLQVSEVRFDLNFRNLFEGKLSSDARMAEPVLNLPASKITSADEALWSSLLNEVITKALRINIGEVHVENGRVNLGFGNNGLVPQLSIEEVSLSVTGLQKVQTSLQRFPSLALGKATVLQSTVSFQLQFNAQKAFADYSLQAEILNLDLEAVTPYLAASGFYYKPKGRFSLYTQAYGFEDKFSGFVHPFFEDVALASLHDVYKEGSIATQCGYRPLRQIPLKGSIRPGEWYYCNAVIFGIHSAFMEGLAPVVHLNNADDGTETQRPPEKKSSGGRSFNKRLSES